LQVDRKRDQLLTHDFVEVTLDPAAIAIGRDDQPLPRRTQLRDFESQPIDLFRQRLDAPSLQLIGLPTP
jgi:hypothetical protein